MHDLAQFLPSYWLVQASHVSTAGHGWGAMGWIVVGAWTAVLVVLARAAYRRDTGRVQLLVLLLHVSRLNPRMRGSGSPPSPGRR